MAGHNKWSKIKRLPGAPSQKRGQFITTLAKEIAVAAKIGGAASDGSPHERMAEPAAQSSEWLAADIGRFVIASSVERLTAVAEVQKSAAAGIDQQRPPLISRTSINFREEGAVAREFHFIDVSKDDRRGQIVRGDFATEEDVLAKISG